MFYLSFLFENSPLLNRARLRHTINKHTYEIDTLICRSHLHSEQKAFPYTFPLSLHKLENKILYGNDSKLSVKAKSLIIVRRG